MPGFDAYEVSSKGRVRRIKRGRSTRVGLILKPQPHKHGYVYYILYIDGVGFSVLAHRLVAMVFIGPPPSEQHQAAHYDGCRINNTPENLRWALPADNHADMYRHGTMLIGKKHPLFKVTDDVIR